MKSIITRLGSLFLALVLLGANLAPVYAETVPDAEIGRASCRERV